MSERGVFAIDRGVFDHDCFADEPFTEREAWMWLIGEASWRERTRRIGRIVVALERGQLAASVRFLADRWSWSKSAVDRFLAKLKKRDMIGTAGGTGINVITICNYDEYQRVSLPDGTDAGTQTGTEAGQRRDKREDIKAIESPSLRSGGKRRRSRSELPEDWQPDETGWAYATSVGHSREKIPKIIEAFRDHHRGRGNTMADWNAAWRTWCRNEVKFERDRQTRAHPAARASQTHGDAVMAGMANYAARRFGPQSTDSGGQFRGGDDAAGGPPAQQGAASGARASPVKLAIVSRGNPDK